MKADGNASFTASFIAVARGLGEQLPDDARLVVDPFGTRFASGWLRFVVRHARFFARLFEHTILVAQLRTRLIDDVVRAFLNEGGDQVVLLGAGFDCRALRLKDALAQTGARVFEVDHPATQAVKRVVVANAGSTSTYVPWDFEARAVSELPAALASAGHDAAKPTLTIWEGVTMYLSEGAVDASLRAMRSWSSPRSPVALSYFTPKLIALGRRGLMRLFLRGEPLRFGLEPASVAPFLADRGFALAVDVSVKDLARTMLPARYHGVVVDENVRFAIARAA